MGCQGEGKSRAVAAKRESDDWHLLSLPQHQSLESRLVPSVEVASKLVPCSIGCLASCEADAVHGVPPATGLLGISVAPEGNENLPRLLATRHACLHLPEVGGRATAYPGSRTTRSTRHASMHGQREGPAHGTMGRARYGRGGGRAWLECHSTRYFPRRHSSSHVDSGAGSCRVTEPTLNVDGRRTSQPEPNSAPRTRRSVLASRPFGIDLGRMI